MLAQPALVNDWLEPWVDEIRGERDPAVRHAIEWAVENAVARHSLDGVAHGRISYERLVCSPETTLPSLFAGLELDGSRAERELGRPSHTSHVSYRDAGDRLSRWRMELGRDTVRAILKWADRFGLTEIGGSTALHFPPEHGVPEETR